MTEFNTKRKLRRIKICQLRNVDKFLFYNYTTVVTIKRKNTWRKYTLCQNKF